MSEDVVATGEPGGTAVGKDAPPASNAHQTMAFDYFAATLKRESFPRSTPASAATASRAAAANVAPAGTPLAARPNGSSTPGPRQLLRGRRLAIVAGLVAALVLGAMIRHAERVHAKPPDASLNWGDRVVTQARASTATQAPTSPEPVAPPEVPSSAAEAPAAPAADLNAATAVAATAIAPATTTAPARPDLSGTWRGEYVDASGRQLLRVVSLSISRVDDDGGIEGTLQYQAASGNGECQLHARGSTYSAGAHRLQLSPQGCSPHHPRELGVPLDFAGVNPRANTLKDGRIEAPTGEVIRVKLMRVGGL
jgi:hypothetical protein